MSEQQQIVDEMRTEMKQAGQDFINCKITYTQYNRRIDEATKKALAKWPQTNNDNKTKTEDK